MKWNITKQVGIVFSIFLCLVGEAIARIPEGTYFVTDPYGEIRMQITVDKEGNGEVRDSQDTFPFIWDETHQLIEYKSEKRIVKVEDDTISVSGPASYNNIAKQYLAQYRLNGYKVLTKGIPQGEWSYSRFLGPKQTLKIDGNNISFGRETGLLFPLKDDLYAIAYKSTPPLGRLYYFHEEDKGSYHITGYNPYAGDGGESWHAYPTAKR